MKQRIFTILFLAAIGIVSCRKDSAQLTIKQYDQQQITSYIAAHGLSGMIRDTSGGDTTGTYYQILTNGKNTANLAFSDKISFVFSLQTVDGQYMSLDTINNHYDDYAGHVTSHALPLGVELAIVNILKHRGTSARLLIPSHLAYGSSGYGTGSSQVANAKIGGNQCLDYYVHIINNQPGDNQATYDDQVIRSYIAANGLTGYNKTASGLYYSVITPATSSVPISLTTTITCTYTGQQLDGSIFDGGYNGTNVATFPIAGLTAGVQEGMLHYAGAGTKIGFLIPSALAYGETAQTGIAVNSCLRFTFQVITATP